MSQEVETIHGFDIPKRELTEEEASREITLERFNEFHAEAGEDFMDQVEYIVNGSVFGGYLLCKYPDKAPEILDILNQSRPSAQELMDIYDDSTNMHDGGDDKFYTDFSEFANLTVKLKKKVNQILIQVAEYYNR